MVKLTKSLKKELRATIRNNLKRYLSLVSIIFLGVMFYVGMKSNAPVLQNSMISFIDEANYMDIEVASVFGITDEEMEQLKNGIPEIETVEGGFEKDVPVDLIDEKGKKVEKNVAIKSYSDKKKINRLYYLQGREAKAIGECVADGSLVGLGYEIGDTIKVEGLDNLLVKDLKIVGFARSPEYISHNKGSSNLTSGKINYFLYVHEDSFDLANGSYNVARIKLKNKYPAFTDEYNDYVEKVKDKIDSVSDYISKTSKDKFLEDINSELQLAKDDFNVQKNAANSELSRAYNQIQNGEKEINQAAENIMSDREVDLYISYNKMTLDTSKEQLDLTKQMIDAFKDITSALSAGEDTELTTDVESLTRQLDSLNNTLKGYEATLDNLNKQLDDKRKSCEGVVIPQVIIACDGAIKSLELRIDAVNMQITNIKNNINAINRVLTFMTSFNGSTQSLKSYISDMEKQYDDAKKKYDKALEDYNYAKDNLRTQMDSARALVDKKKEELEAAKAKYDEKYKEVTIELEKGQEKIESAELIVNKLMETSWYEFTRNDSNGYSQYYDDVSRINGLAKLLPLIFFSVAGLVTASSISRMATEEREKMGVLKSLGYTGTHILYKYLYYAISAAVIGSIFGIVVGSLVFPKIFAGVYSIIYYIIKIKYSIYPTHIIVALSFAFVSTILVAYLSVKSTLKESASDLMRPKNTIKKVYVSKKAKKWRKMSFFRKVTIRNIILNKGKSLMTVLGVAGCTALIVTGFGARESISDIIFYQYGNIFDIGAELFYDDDLTEFEIEEIKDKITTDGDVVNTTLARMETVSVKVGLKTFEVFLTVPNNLNEFNKVINLIDVKKDTKLSLNNEGVIISEKIAKLLNVKVGDNISYTNGDNFSFEVKVIGIAQNYVYHYMYMTPSLYKKLNNVEIKNNLLLVKFTDEVDPAKKCHDYSIDGDFVSYLSIKDAKNAYDDIISRFDMILFVIIISAALLAFVVLYNLAKINISEKTREIATLKVLGFRPKEVNKYINREMIILTIVGIAIGLVGGIALTEVVVSTCELDDIMFYHGVSYTSLIYAALLTTVFSIVINLFVKKDIKKIDLVESLKTTE